MQQPTTSGRGPGRDGGVPDGAARAAPAGGARRGRRGPGRDVRLGEPAPAAGGVRGRGGRRAAVCALPQAEPARLRLPARDVRQRGARLPRRRPGAGVETPEIFGLAFEEERLRFTLLMTDLQVEPGVRVGSVLEPVTPDDVGSLLVTLARLHAAFWESGRLDTDLAWLARPTDCPTMRFWRQIGPKLTARHLTRGHRAGAVDRGYWADERIWPGFDRMLAVDDDGPRTVLHGDVHAGNVYYRDGAPGGLLDWQLALQGSWALDVSYLVTSALDPEQRAAHERGLLETYLAELAAHGVAPPAFDDAWLRYRQNALYGVLMWFITPEGVHTDAAQREFLRRCVRAGEELDTLGALGV